MTATRSTAAGRGIDPDAYAALLCDWCLEVRSGQQILIATTTLAIPAVRALHRALLEREAWPVVRLAPPELAADFLRDARDAQLDAHAPVELAELEAIDATLRIEAPGNTNALASIDPARLARFSRGRRAVQQARSARRWSLSTWPTPALAQEARMGDEEYAAFVARALFLDREDPLDAWRELSRRQAGMVERLVPARRIHIASEHTDLQLEVAGRTWINSDGRRNMPSGEVFTGPLETSANGTIRFDIPSNVRGANVTGAQLTFRDGEVVQASAEQGEEHLRAALASDEGARFLGELGIGTNRGIDRATGSTLLDEKMAGTIHLALGRSYPETGGTNVSALHWDLICDLRSGGMVSVDGEPLIADGEILGIE
jgi:aminopeptidase